LTAAFDGYDCRQLTFEDQQPTPLPCEVGVLIELLCCTDLGMAEDKLGVAVRHAGVLQRCCGGMTQPVHSAIGKACLLSDAFQGAQQIVRHDGVTRRGAEGDFVRVGRAFSTCNFASHEAGVVG